MRGEPVCLRLFRAYAEALELDWQELAGLDRDDVPMDDDFGDEDEDDDISGEISFYVSRPTVEEKCARILRNPGSLLRLKGSQKMGKTCLIAQRIRPWCDEAGFRFVRVNCRIATEPTLQEGDAFFQWFCQEVSKALGLDPVDVSEYWRSRRTPLRNCEGYFEKYILKQAAASGFVLCLDHIEELFEQPVADEFFAMLRAWHEQAQDIDCGWRAVRMLIAYSWQDLAIQDRRSPFANVGELVKLPELDTEQVKTLAAQYGLTIADDRLQRLRQFVGGNPEQVAKFFVEVQGRAPEAFDRALEQSATMSGIFAEHCRRLCMMMREQPELARGFIKVLDAPDGLLLDDPMLVERLCGMGLVRLDGDRVSVRCELYRKYFTTYRKYFTTYSPLVQ
ncbi:MAG: AAA-like domain-containing protein [Geitlerinemataceae cyanobacterium]